MHITAREHRRAGDAPSHGEVPPPLVRDSGGRYGCQRLLGLGVRVNLAQRPPRAQHDYERIASGAQRVPWRDAHARRVWRRPVTRPHPPRSAGCRAARCAVAARIKRGSAGECTRARGRCPHTRRGAGAPVNGTARTATHSVGGRRFPARVWERWCRPLELAAAGAALGAAPACCAAPRRRRSGWQGRGCGGQGCAASGRATRP